MSLDRTITIERFTEARDQFGAITQEWTVLRTLRAKLIQASASEYLAGAGLEDRGTVIFRTRWADIALSDRLMFEGAAHDIKDIREIGRRRGLEIRTQRND